jgi:long-chain acyl-CoA synthetase
MIITGGENVYSVEVENALAAHPAVFEAAVFGVPDARWGEAVNAVVVLRPGAHADEAALVAWCRGRIGGYKVPKSIAISAEPLPKSGPGKIAKHLLRRIHG